MSDKLSSARAWFVVALLWTVACLNYLDRMMVTTMRGSLIEAIPMSEAQFGLLTSAFLWVYGGLSPFAGFLADRFSRSRVIIVSLLAWSAITWLTGYARTFEQLVAARAMMGISEACYIPAALALIADFHRGATRSLATGIHMTGISVGAGLGGIGGMIAERHGWSAPFSYFGIFGVLYSLLLMLCLRDAPRASTCGLPLGDVKSTVGFREALVSLFSRGAFILVLIFWGLLGVAGWAFAGWLPTYLNEQFHLAQGVAGISATAYLQAAALMGVLVGGAWADRWSRTDARGPIFVPAIGLCLATPGVLLAADSGVLSMLICGLVIYGFFRAFSDANMMPILCLVSDPRYRATGYGVLNCFSCLIGGLAIYAGGALRDINVDLSYLFHFSAASLVVCAILLFLVKPTQTAARVPFALPLAPEDVSGRCL